MINNALNMVSNVAVSKISELYIVMRKQLMKNSNLLSFLSVTNRRAKPKGLSASHQAVGPVRRTESQRSAHNDSNESP